ncbi:hypothetical protein BVRB_9g216930 [Beta vulgaris subsp. vulgaris]|nr:hypothetical protein BVRB_9g216930 [Beta vulgaris subsp. vulgaris]
MPSFLKDFFPSVYKKEELNTSTNQYCKFDSQIVTLFTSTLYIAALLASLVASTVTRKLGRRLSMLVGGFLFCSGAIINALAQNVAMLIIGRALLGFGVGFANQSVPLYLAEMAPYKYRGALNIIFQLSITIGILVANVLNYFFAMIDNWGWRLSLGGATIPAIIIIIGSLVLPDTPNSLIERGMHDKAISNLRKIRGIEQVDKEFNDLVEASEASKKVNHPWRNLLQRRYRSHLTMAIAIPFFQQFTGINVIMFYAPILFKTIGFQNNASLMSSVITGAFNVLATLVSIYGVDKWGRRILFIEGGIQMFVCQVVVAILIGLKFRVSGNLSSQVHQWYAIVLVLFICTYVCAFAWSWGPLGWLVPSEIFPLEIRSAAQSINVSVNMFFTFVVAQVFLTMLCHLKFGLFLFFAFFLFLMSVFIYFFLPETKGMPIEEMSIVWKNHWFWGRFITHNDDDLKMAKMGQPPKRFH